MLYRVRERIKKSWFNICCSDMLLTPPIEAKKGRLIIVSMVSHSDVMMYLIAIKSLFFYLREGEIIILNDGTLTSKDIELLTYHVSPSQIVLISNINTGKCPQGGCWERLLFILDHVKENYVIQLDSDNIALHNIPEVTDCIRTNRSFLLSGPSRQRIQPMSVVCERMKAVNSSHIQVLAEKNLDKIPNYEQLKYVRGSAGFAGFAKGSFSRLEVGRFSKEMEKIVGSKWSNWGSEQVTSNFIISNSLASIVLPYSKYAGYYAHPKIHYEDSHFLHFIGTNRFKKGLYLKLAKKVIKKLLMRQWKR